MITHLVLRVWVLECALVALPLDGGHLSQPAHVRLGLLWAHLTIQQRCSHAIAKKGCVNVHFQMRLSMKGYNEMPPRHSAT